MQLLLKAGADVYFTDERDMTPLQHAIHAGHEACACALLSAMTVDQAEHQVGPELDTCTLLAKRIYGSYFGSGCLL